MTSCKSSDLGSWDRKKETEGTGEVKTRIKKGLDVLRVSGCLIFLECWVLEGKDFTLNPATHAPQILPPSKGSQLEGKPREATPEASLLPTKAASSHAAASSPLEKRELSAGREPAWPQFWGSQVRGPGGGAHLLPGREARRGQLHHLP